MTDQEATQAVEIAACPDHRREANPVTEEVAATMRYCLAHCDNEAETELVLWVREKLQDAGVCL